MAPSKARGLMIGEPRMCRLSAGWDPTVAQRYTSGNVVSLEDPGTMVGSYDYCPTGNEADLPGGAI
jgi:hypothetical protein